MSNDRRSADNKKHILNTSSEQRSDMNTPEKFTENNIVEFQSIGGKHTSNTKSTEQPIRNKELDRLWLEHFARAIYKNGLLDDRQYRKLLSMIDRELARMYHKAA